MLRILLVSGLLSIRVLFFGERVDYEHSLPLYLLGETQTAHLFLQGVEPFVFLLKSKPNFYCCEDAFCVIKDISTDRWVS